MASRADDGQQAEAADHDHPVMVDEGMRRWYKSWPCCMGAAYPEIKRRLDEQGWVAQQGWVAR